MNWNDYKVSNKSDKTLMGDFKLLVAEYKNVNMKKESELKSVENIIELAKPIINKILSRGKVTFNVNKMGADTLELFQECMVRLIKKKHYIKSPYPEAIWLGKCNDLISDNKDFKILVSRNLAFGFIRFNGQIREFIGFDIPYKLTSLVPLIMPLDFDLSKLSDNILIDLHDEVHDESRIYSINTGKPPLNRLVNKHSYIIKEIKSRKLNHVELVELDKMSNKSIVNNVFVKEILEKWKGSTIIRNSVLSIMGDSCISGLDKRLKICINWPEFDGKSIETIKAILIQALPEKIRNKIDFCIDKQTDEETYYIPIAELQIKMIPVEKRELLFQRQGMFSEQRINGKK